MLVAPLLDVDGDARHLRVVRRRVRRTRRDNHTDVPGVILFEIDGLGEGVLREAIRDGHVPTIARWLLGRRSHRLLGWECDLSSQTGASQAGLLLGSNWDMPAFRWYEKESGRTIVSNHPADAAEIERRRSTGDGPARRRGHEPGQHVLGRRAALHGHDERHPRPHSIEGRRPVRLLLRSLRLPAHDRAVARRHRLRAPGGPPPAPQRRRARRSRWAVPADPGRDRRGHARPRRRRC